MKHSDFHHLVLCGCVMALLMGCGQRAPQSAGSTTGNNPPGNTPLPTQPPPPTYSSGVSLSRPSVIVGTNGWGPTLVYHASPAEAIPMHRWKAAFRRWTDKGMFICLPFTIRMAVAMNCRASMCMRRILWVDRHRYGHCPLAPERQLRT